MNETFDDRLRTMITEICKENQSWLQKDEPKNFKDFIDKHRINKSTFGEIIGVSGSTITKYLEHPDNLKISQVLKLANETNVDVRNLIDLINETT